MATFDSAEEWEKVHQGLSQKPEILFGIQNDPNRFNNLRSSSSSQRFADGEVQRKKNIIFWINGVYHLDLETFQVDYRWVRICLYRRAELYVLTLEEG